MQWLTTKNVSNIEIVFLFHVILEVTNLFVNVYTYTCKIQMKTKNYANTALTVLSKKYHSIQKMLQHQNLIWGIKPNQNERLRGLARICKILLFTISIINVCVYVYYTSCIFQFHSIYCRILGLQTTRGDIYAWSFITSANIQMTIIIKFSCRAKKFVNWLQTVLLILKMASQCKVPLSKELLYRSI